MPYSKPWPLAAMQTSIVGKRSVNAQQLTGIDAIKSVEIDCVNATIVCKLKQKFIPKQSKQILCNAEHLLKIQR